MSVVDAARDAIEEIIGPQRAALLSVKPPSAEKSIQDLEPTALILYNLSCLRRSGQISCEEAARVRKFVLSPAHFRALKALGAIENTGDAEVKAAVAAKRNREVSRLTAEGDANQVVQKRFLRASLSLVEEWEAEQARFLNATLNTVKFAIRKSTTDGLVSQSQIEQRSKLCRELAACVDSSVQLTRSLDMKSHPLVAGKVVPATAMLGAKRSTLKRFGARPVWALLDPPDLHFYHKKVWDESLTAWASEKPGAGMDDSFNGSMLDTSLNSSRQDDHGMASEGPAYTLHLDAVESCVVSSTTADKVELLVSEPDKDGVYVESMLEFRAVGSGTPGAGAILGVANGTRAASSAAMAWKHHIDANLGYSRVLRPLMNDAALFKAASDCNQYYDVLQSLYKRNSLDVILPLSFVRRQTAVAETLKVSRVDASPQVAKLQRAVRQGQAPHPMAHTNMNQVRKDLPRDSLKVNGRTYTHMQGDAAVELLTNEILTFVRRSPAMLRAQSGTSSSDDNAPSPSASARASNLKNAEATAMVFARRVLLGSTRTVSGGDAYDAVEWFFGNQESAVMICLDPSNTDAVSISFYDAPSRDSNVQETEQGPSGGGGAASNGSVGPGISQKVAADDFSMQVSRLSPCL
eukprot:INCI12867.2.p1 GENE.INCI12867.2~~INCI12867.2.p1  ORF type:complete len:635 (-),score=119.56 INCI12867.2:731-2635(-)